MLVGAGVEKKMSSIWNQFMQHSLAGLNRSRVAGFHPLGDKSPKPKAFLPPSSPPASASANSTTAASAKVAFETPSKKSAGPPWPKSKKPSSSPPAPNAKPTSTPPADLTRKPPQPHPPNHETAILADWACLAPALPVFAFPISCFPLCSHIHPAPLKHFA